MDLPASVREKMVLALGLGLLVNVSPSHAEPSRAEQDGIATKASDRAQNAESSTDPWSVGAGAGTKSPAEKERIRKLTELRLRQEWERKRSLRAQQFSAGAGGLPLGSAHNAGASSASSSTSRPIVTGSTWSTGVWAVPGKTLNGSTKIDSTLVKQAERPECVKCGRG